MTQKDLDKFKEDKVAWNRILEQEEIAIENLNRSSQNVAKPTRSYFRNCYRVIEDKFNGYEAQVKFWWFPYSWFQMWKGFMPTNTWASLEDAQDFINNGSKSKRTVYWVSKNCG